jgi:hypothetical protein
VTGLQLTAAAEHDRAQWEREYERRGCYCCVSPPCGSCTHPGNPANQAEDDTCWETATPLLFAVGDLALRSRAIVAFSKVTDEEWLTIAKTVTHPELVDRLIAHAQRTPYFDLDGYMERWWLHPAEDDKQSPLASIRIHHILRADHERHLHNHPWAARTIILKGWYRERRMVGGVEVETTLHAGDTAAIGVDTFHSIDEVSPGGVWTMFFMSPWQKTWGFDTDHGFVPWRTYLNVPENAEG